ncbi:MAG: hypothetical protein O7A63_09120 [Acidobacteria bacterium]|nr:hypothetical protein [Acidobacteriota bacterium]
MTGRQGHNYPLPMPIHLTLVGSMINGLPWSTWLLLIAAIGPVLLLVLRFYVIHRGRDRSAAPRQQDRRG